MAFFGVKLYGKDIFIANSTGKLTAIFTACRYMRGIVAHHMVSVYKIESGVFFQPCKQGLLACHRYPIPAHMRYFQLIGRERRAGKPPHRPRQQTKPGALAFFTGLKQYLHAQTNPHERDGIVTHTLKPISWSRAMA